jgi:hypothetical protein
MKQISLLVACGMLVYLAGCGQGRGPDLRQQSRNNMREIARAVRAYAEDKRGRLPAPAFRDPLGRVKEPLLSWRIALLPYLDEKPLFREFRLDEPWDSEHNRKLIPKMPDLYRNPRARDLAEGMTCYLMPVGEETAFPNYADSPNENGEFDRTIVKRDDVNGETIILFEVSPENAVVWTKPDDWQYDPQDPRRDLFGAGRGYFQVTLADGRVTYLPHHISKASMRALITRSGDDDPGEYTK